MRSRTKILVAICAVLGALNVAFFATAQPKPTLQSAFLADLPWVELCDEETREGRPEAAKLAQSGEWELDGGGSGSLSELLSSRSIDPDDFDYRRFRLEIAPETSIGDVVKRFNELSDLEIRNLTLLNLPEGYLENSIDAVELELVGWGKVELAGNNIRPQFIDERDFLRRDIPPPPCSYDTSYIIYD